MIGTQRQILQLVVFSISLFLATFAIVCRIWARQMTRTRWRANDYMMLFAYITAAGLVASGLVAVIEGELGVPIATLPPSKIVKILPMHYKMTLVDTILLSTSAAFTNLSISHFYTTLFPHPWLLYTCRVHMACVTLFWIAVMISSCLICRPLDFLWNRKQPGGQCFDIREYWLWASVVSLCFDITNLILPMPTLWHLNLERAKRIKLIILFGLGSLVCAVTAFRIHYDLTLDTRDVTWTASPILLFSVTEPCLGILAGCLPIISPIFTRASRKLRYGLSHMTGSDPNANSGADGTARKTQKKSSLHGSNGGFIRLRPDPYALTDVLVSKEREPGAIRTNWEMDMNEAERKIELKHEAVGFKDTCPFGGIKVDRQVHVQSSTV